jgi:hypothetical protein
MSSQSTRVKRLSDQFGRIVWLGYEGQHSLSGKCSLYYVISDRTEKMQATQVWPNLRSFGAQCNISGLSAVYVTSRDPGSNPARTLIYSDGEGDSL